MRIKKTSTLEISFQKQHNAKQLTTIHNEVGASIVVVPVFS